MSPGAIGNGVSGVIGEGVVGDGVSDVVGRTLRGLIGCGLDDVRRVFVESYGMRLKRALKGAHLT